MEIFDRIRKAELHAHLNGSIEPKVILDIMLEEGIIHHKGFIEIRDLMISVPTKRLSEYIRVWDYLRLVPTKQSNLVRMCYSAFNGFSHNMISYVEVRSSLLYLCNLLRVNSTEALCNLIDALKQPADELGIKFGLILTVPRGPASERHLLDILAAFLEAGRPREVVGIDLAGDEDLDIAPSLPSRFRAAKDDYGLGITIHAGETGNAANIVRAIREFGADRIGHGLAAASEPKVIDLILESNVCLEVCPISSRLTGSVPVGDTHPINMLAAKGIPFVICSDNPGLHGRGLNEDYHAARSEGLPTSHFAQQFDLAMRYAFSR